MNNKLEAVRFCFYFHINDHFPHILFTNHNCQSLDKKEKNLLNK
jgi:hypothetical protein